MAGEYTLVRDLAVVLLTAAATSLLFQRLRQPVVLGYLVAGILVGLDVGNVPLIRDPANIAVLAEIGILFLLFSLGLDFHLPKLKRVGGVAVVAGILETSLMVGMGILAARLFGWSSLDALFLGAILAISSTTIIVKLSESLRLRRAASTQVVFGILLVEDLVAILLIGLLSSIALTGALELYAVAEAVLRIGIFVVATLVLGLVVVPRLIDRVARLEIEESLVITALAVAFAMSLVALLLGLSIALGAFIAGAVVAESRASAVVERKITPLRDVFTAVFFVSTGILLDPAQIVGLWLPILVLTALSILGKIGAVSLATFVAGYEPPQALRVGLQMAMIGEFSFIIATLGRDLGVTSDFLLPIAVSVSVLTSFLAPFLIQRSDRIVGAASRLAPPVVRDYARMYTSWVGRRRSGGFVGFPGGFELRTVLRLFAYAVLLAGIVIGTILSSDAVSAALGHTLVVEGDVLVLTWAVAALAAAPVVLGLLHAVQDLVQRLVDVVIPREQATTARGAAAASVLRNTLYVFLSFVAMVFAFAASVAFVPSLPLLIGAFLVVGTTVYILWGSLKRFNRHLAAAVDTVFAADAPPAMRDEVLSLIRDQVPWETTLESVLVPAASRAAHRQIRDLGLPQRTGATIVTHEREGRHVVNPTPETILLPGDAVGLLGDAEQVAEAKRFLVSEAPAAERPATTGEVRVEEVPVPEHSPLAGRTLAGSRLRERTGASIVGVRREGRPIHNPPPVLRLQPGDHVILLGTPEQVASARRLVEARGG